MAEFPFARRSFKVPSEAETKSQSLAIQRTRGAFSISSSRVFARWRGALKIKSVSRQRRSASE